VLFERRIPRDKILRSSELLGREVAPAMRDELARRAADTG
jgi:hypothetical protein